MTKHECRRSPRRDEKPGRSLRVCPSSRRGGFTLEFRSPGRIFVILHWSVPLGSGPPLARWPLPIAFASRAAAGAEFCR